MKKGLLTVLLASLVLVGCQNYDDQFDDLNAQISALKSQVDGLSSLSGQVSSLSGTISGLQSGIAAATAAANAAGTSADAATAAAGAIDLSGLSASLTALQAEVDAIEAAIATTATAAEVAALQTSLTAVETDLADLLTSNNVYATAITVSDAATMASALALGNKVALMNNNVTITDNATISDTDIQTFINRIKTMNGTFKYDSGSATGFAPTFDEMVAGTVFDLKMAGPISAKKLASATTMTITTTYSTTITSFDMSALASVTSISSGADGAETANTLALSSATNVDLGALPRYGASLSITTKKDATLDIALLDDKSTAGAQSDLALTLNGPASVNLSLIDDGTITLQNVATATVSGFYGTLDIKSGVETLTTTDSVFIDLDSASDLVTATLDFKADWDPALTTANAAISAAGYSTSYLEDYSATGSIIAADLKTLTITGDLLDVYLDEANLETLSINANMTDLTMSSLSDLTSLTVAGGKIGNITLTASNNLAVANFDHTSNMENKGSATANKSVSLSVTNNTSLTKLHSTGDDVETLTITGNTALAELDFTGLADDGAETSALAGGVTIWGNALVATSASNTSDGETDRAAGLATDLGSFNDGTSGMDTLKTYLTHIAATAGSTAFVTFDTLQTETDTETTGTTTTTLNIADAGDGSTTNKATVLKMTAATANTASTGFATTTQKMGWYVDQGATGGTIQLVINGATIPATAYTLTGNDAYDAAQFASAANVAAADAAGATLAAKVGAYSHGRVQLIAHATNATTAVGERYATTAALTAASTDTQGVGDTALLWSVGLEDLFTLTVGSNTITTSLSSGATTIGAIETKLAAVWATKYGGAGTASGSAIATLTGTLTDGDITITMLQKDSAGYDQTVSFAVADGASTTSSRTADNIGWYVGATMSSNDNNTIENASDGLIITVASEAAGSLDNTLSSVTTATDGSKATMVAFTTTYTANTTFASNYANAQVERTDVANVEAAVAAATSNAVAATTFNRVAWLG